MSSALAAFAKAQQEAQEVPPQVEKDEGGYTSGHQDEVAADTGKEQLKPRKSVTLVDIAKQQQSKAQPARTLMDVAAAHQREATTTHLTALAVQVNAEEQQAAKRRAEQIERELVVTSKQVQQEAEIKRHALVAQALQEAAREEAAAYSEHEDDFEQEEDPTVYKAAEKVVEATQPTAKRQLKTLSVDRQVLKQREQSHGLAHQSKSTSKAKTMKEKMSSFQCQQLSLTQQRVFLAMLVDDCSAKGKRRTCNMYAIEELAKDRATQLKQKQKLLKIKPPVYAKFDDNKHCRFKPRVKSAGEARRCRDAHDDDDDDGGNQRTDDFIKRMEATERVRNETLRRTRAEREYNARIDKKECPQCGNPQSYAELTQKRKKCPNCGVTYKSRLAWSDIADEFLERMAAHLQQRLSWRRQQPSDALAESDNQRDDQKEPKKWRDVRDEFLGRVQLDMMQRELSKELILKELEAACTFSPEISDRARRLQLGDFDERLRRDLENRRVRQQQYRLLSAAIAKAEAAKATKPIGEAVKRKPKLKSFEERLRLDVAQRRERQLRNDNPKLLTVGRSRGLY